MTLITDHGDQEPAMSFGGTAPGGGALNTRNSACTLSATPSSISAIGNNTYQIIIHVTFNEPYEGGRYIYVTSYSDYTFTHYEAFAYSGVHFYVTGNQPATPSAIRVTPDSGLSLITTVDPNTGSLQDANSKQTFNVTLKNGNGVFNNGYAELIFVSGANWSPGHSYNPSQRCKVVAEISAQQIWLEDDGVSVPVNSKIFPGKVSFGSPNSPALLSNSHCTLYPQVSSIRYQSLDTLIMTFSVSFTGALAGYIQEHVYVQSNTGTSYWDTQSAGNWHWFGGSSSGYPLPSAFVSCVTAATGPATCALVANSQSGYTIPYLLSNALVVGRSGITICGAGSNSATCGVGTYPTVLQRSPTYDSGRLISVVNNVNNVAISNLTLDGNRNGVEGSPGAYRVLNDVCEATGCADLWIGDTNTGATFISITASHFTNTGRFSIVIQNAPTNQNVTNNISITNSLFEEGHEAFIDTGSFNSLGPGDNGCGAFDTPAKLAVAVPRVITIQGNTFIRSYTGAVGFQQAQTATVSNNTFIDNQYFPNGDETSGGMLVTFFCTDDITISNNFFDGTNVGGIGAQGMELHGLRHNLNNNRVFNMPGAGIYMNGVQHLSLEDLVLSPPNRTIVQNAGVGQKFYSVKSIGGFQLQNVRSLQTVHDVDIHGITSQLNPIGLFFYADADTVMEQTMDNIHIANGCFTQNVVSPPIVVDSSVILTNASFSYACPAPIH